MAAKHPCTMLDDKLVQMALYDPVPGIAEDAATALGNMGNGGLISLYLRNPSSFSGTEETGRRRRIADSAYSLRAPGCILALKMLANDADSEIRQTAYVGLSKTYDPEVGRILADASTHDPDPRYRELARESLKRWKKKQAAGRPSTADFTMPPDA